jgi:hypothetical protein
MSPREHRGIQQGDRCTDDDCWCNDYLLARAKEHHVTSKEKLFNKAEPLTVATPSAPFLRVYTQGQILFFGHYWMTLTDAIALRDWLNKVLP